MPYWLKWPLSSQWNCSAVELRPFEVLIWAICGLALFLCCRVCWHWHLLTYEDKTSPAYARQPGLHPPLHLLGSTWRGQFLHQLFTALGSFYSGMNQLLTSSCILELLHLQKNYRQLVLACPMCIYSACNWFCVCMCWINSMDIGKGLYGNKGPTSQRWVWAQFP